MSIRYLLSILAIGCSQPAQPQQAAEPPTITVFAAASLTNALEEVGEHYQPAHVRFSFGGSQILRHQIEEGAPADVLIAASEDHVRGPIAARLDAPRTLVCNEPVLVVPQGSPIRSFQDLPHAERLVLGTPEVPIGAYSEQILHTAGAHFGGTFEVDVRAHIASRELDVRQVLAKVDAGEADAGIVYRTDVVVGHSVRAVAIPRELNVIARYPIAIVRASSQRDAARAWIAYLTTGEGHAALLHHGFTDCP
jgi:molybdate transport system substrate-binding protein